MPGESNSEVQARAIREFKRRQWAQPGAASEYRFSAYKPDPLTRIKNVTEISLVTRFARGPRVLDAGAGTGRFTLPLRQKGFNTVALDISSEMLREGQALAAKMGEPFPCILADIERSPFTGETFDSVVSITVLRHFPDWRDILTEYVRVTRPGGRILFEMGSGDHQALLNRLGVGVGQSTVENGDPIQYDAPLASKELRELAESIGLTRVETIPYDFFNASALVQHVLQDAYADFKTRLLPLLEKPAVVWLYEIIVRRILPSISPALCPSWFVVLEKTRPAGRLGAPDYLRAASLVPQGSPEQRLTNILKCCLGRRFAAAMREIARAASEPETRAFLDLCREQLLPRFPLEALYWHAE
jgi:SAM-dependent methyltransferase